jgi:hypothetical protein
VSAVNCTSSGEYTEISDGKRPNQCMTVSGSSPYQLYDLTCSPGKASQEWGVLPEGSCNCGVTGITYALFNEYMQQKVPACVNNHTRLIYAGADSGTGAGLTMGCPTSEGDPTNKELWYAGA